MDLDKIKYVILRIYVEEKKFGVMPSSGKLVEVQGMWVKKSLADRFDERSLYFEQKFVSLHDNFIRAIALCKNTAVNCDVIGGLRDQFNLRQPPCPGKTKRRFWCSKAVLTRLCNLAVLHW